MNKRKLRNLKETAVRAVFFLNGIVAVLILVGIFILLLFSAVPAFREVNLKEFLFGKLWDPTSPLKPSYGILSQVFSSFLVTIAALVLAVPVGLAVAAYLSDVAPWRVREIVKPVVEILAGIPSVVIGFLGIVVLGPALGEWTGQSHGLNALNGAVLLAIMSLPTIVSISEDALSAVPQAYSEGSLALGGSRWQTLLRVKFPAALSGIIAAVMLGMGRAIGETMTLLMATGNARSFPEGLFDSVRTLTSNIAIELGEVPYFTTHYYALFAVGLVLFILTFLVNLGADLVLRKYQEREQ